MTFLHTLRRQVLWLALGVALATLAALSWTALPAVPIVAGGVAALVLAVNTITARLREHVCLGCGASTSGLPHGEHGVICPGCGHVSSVMHLRDDHAGPILDERGRDLAELPHFDPFDGTDHAPHEHSASTAAEAHTA